MTKAKKIPDYGTVMKKDGLYYRTRVSDVDGRKISLYAKTPEELYEKVQQKKQEIEEETLRSKKPTVRSYSEKWLRMQNGRIRATTLHDYEMKVRNYIIRPLGTMLLSDVTADDVLEALIPAQQKSESIYQSVQMLYKLIFTSAKDNHLIKESPCDNISAKGGKSSKEKPALTNDQVQRLLKATKGLPPYLFVMIGLYTGLRREEILALQWDCVHLSAKAPYLSVKRAWHSEHNRPVISTDLKTDAAKRDVPIPPPLARYLREVKRNSNSEFVVSNRDGGPLAYSQFQRVWKYIRVRSIKERTYTRYKNGEKIIKTVNPVLGEQASHNKDVVYTLDFDVTPHQLRHTYITNLIHAGVDPKTVQYLAGHENSKITMDIYAKVKYNNPGKLQPVIDSAFAMAE